MTQKANNQAIINIIRQEQVWESEEEASEKATLLPYHRFPQSQMADYWP
ncbi:hypothetical protein [Paenibacillus sp. BJ-4]|nr:hypothetical protein [Paenibacillus sp. BJ-4]